MVKNIRVAFIGGGVMAEAMIQGMLKNQVVDAGLITVAEPRAERREDLHQRFHVAVTGDNRAAAEGAGVVVLSVKPQVLPLALTELSGKIPREALVLSIAAGVRTAAIVDGLAHPFVVRAMPNTPAQIGEGMTVWFPAPGAKPAHKEQTAEILGALGAAVAVEDEDFLDMATAVSGSGPAYVFLFIEALEDAAVQLGFPRAMAEKLVLQTVKGSADYAARSGRHPAELRNQVTSPGGTTAEGIFSLEESGFRASLARAVWAAFRRAVQLGKGKKKSEIADR